MIGRFCAILGGIALTWTSVAFGLLLFSARTHGRPGIREAKGKVLRIEQALNQYSLDRGRCPAKRANLIEGGYLREKDLVDPWGRAVEYLCSDNEVRVYSAGPDGVAGTCDDVKNEH